MRVDQLVEVFQRQAGQRHFLRDAALFLQPFRLRVDGVLMCRATVASLRGAETNNGRNASSASGGYLPSRAISSRSTAGSSMLQACFEFVAEMRPRVGEVLLQLLIHRRIDDLAGFKIDEAFTHLLPVPVRRE